MFFLIVHRKQLVLCATSVIITALCLSCGFSRLSPAEVSRKADTALESGDTTHAIKLLESQVKKGDTDPEGYIQLGRLHRSCGSIVDNLCSQRVLELGLQRYPDNPGILVELGKTYYKQTFYGDAERLFKRALSIDKDYCEAHIYLGVNAYRKWKHIQLYTDYLKTTVEHFRYAVDCEPAREDVCFILAFSRYVLGDTTFTLKTCDMCRAKHPQSCRTIFLQGAIAFEHDQYDVCSNRFNEALLLLPDDDRINYIGIDLLINGDEKEAYEAASEKDKEIIAQTYWLEHDPDPTTQTNERFLEHVYRMFLADVRFTLEHLSSRGWEAERGKALVKFGWPTHVRTTLEGRRPWDGRMEIWSYFEPETGFTLYFRDEFLNGDYMVPTDYAFSWSAQTLFEDPPVSLLKNASALLPGVLDVVTFRDSDVGGTVYLLHAADRDSLKNHLWTWDIDTYIARTAFFDETGNSEGYHADTLTAASVEEPATARGNSICIVQAFNLPFDSYRVAYNFEDELKVTQSILWSDANTLRYLGNSLAISDILFCNEPLSTMGGPFVTRALRTFSPNPRCEYHPGDKLRLYMEVYNLGLSGGKSEFAATYSIHATDAQSSRWERIGRGLKRLIQLDTSPDPVISQTILRTGVQPIAAEELAIDIAVLEPGDYVLSVSVEDKLTGERAGSSKVFTKLPSESN